MTPRLRARLTASLVAGVLALAASALVAPSPEALRRPGAGATPASPRAVPTPACALADPSPVGTTTAMSTARVASLAAAAPGGSRWTLSGRVLERDGERPIPGARVAARPPGGGPVRGAQADARGWFTLAAGEAPALEVVAVAPGYLVPAPLRISSGAQGVDLLLERGLTVSGRVALLGSGASGVQATVRLDGDEALLVTDAQLQVDDGGAFSFSGLPPGVPLRLVASAPGWTTTALALAPLEADLHDVALCLRPRVAPPPGCVDPPRPARPDAAPAPAPHPLAQHGEVRVEARPFLDGAGRPRRAPLLIDPLDAAEAAPLEVPLDEAGRPRLEALPAGRYAVSFVEPAAAELRAWTLELEALPGEPLALGHSETAPRGEVTGRLVGWASDGELVQVELRPVRASGESSPSFAFVAACALDADGRFRFAAVPPGVYGLGAVGATVLATGQVEVLPGRAAWVELVAGP